MITEIFRTHGVISLRDKKCFPDYFPAVSMALGRLCDQPGHSTPAGRHIFALNAAHSVIFEGHAACFLVAGHITSSAIRLVNNAIDVRYRTRPGHSAR